MSLARPYLLLLELLLPVYLYFRYFRRGSRGIPLTFDQGTFPGGWRLQLRFLPELFLLLALSLLIFALARPQRILEFNTLSREGIAIEMVIDRSSSMGAPVEGTEGNRLDLVKEVFKEFVLGNDKELSGRPNDLIGLVRFARYADTQAPLTLSHQVLVQFLDSMELVDKQEEDGTSIGDAVVLAAARLKDRELDKESDYLIKSKVIILLTDGISNMGEYSPMEAAEQAAEWDIPIYAIGFREKSLGQMLLGLGGYGSEGLVLEQMAEKSGGRFFEATSKKELTEIYRIIDELEVSSIESLQNQSREELYPPYILAALICVLLYVLSDILLFRRISG